MKGYVPDNIEVFAVILSFAIVCLIGYIILDLFQDQAPSTGMDEKYFIGGKLSIVAASNMAIILFIIMVIFAIYSAATNDVHPALLPFSIILVIISGVILMVIGDVWYKFSRTADFASATNEFSMLTHILDNTLEIGIIIGIVLLVALYAKHKSGGVGY